MKANPHPPSVIFGQNTRYLVPLFQRPYVWTKKDQWHPLWEDVRTVAERLLEAPATGFGAPQVPPHFLGAVVIDQQFTATGFIPTQHIVDGQQRLTTLQLLLDAAQWVVEQHGVAVDAQALRVLVLNDAALTQHPDEVFKVWPTDRDQDAFRATMSNDVEVPPNLQSTRIAEAHSYFVSTITDWATANVTPGAVAARLNALVRTLRDYLKIVVIDLEPGDNAQVIFETLNHRGTPLLAADLVKNFVFQLAQSRKADVQQLYHVHWRALDSDYWRQLVAQGRLYRPRIDVFLNYWLTMKLQREVPADRIFTEFRDHVLNHVVDIGGLLAELARDAKVYERLEQAPPGSVEGDFYYRVIRALDSAAVGPFLLWVLRNEAHEMPTGQRQRCLRAVESWLVRRALCRATAKQVNQIVIELLKVAERAGPSTAGDAVEAFLVGQTADSRYWPDDAALHSALDEEPLYQRVTRPRLRMLLEALEDRLRTSYGEGQRCPRGLTVEHVMPQAWRTYWDDGTAADPMAAAHRDRLVHSIGNLTLVNGKFNAVLSNRPWTTAEAEGAGLGHEASAATSSPTANSASTRLSWPLTKINGRKAT